MAVELRSFFNLRNKFCLIPTIEREVIAYLFSGFITNADNKPSFKRRSVGVKFAFPNF